MICQFTKFYWGQSFPPYYVEHLIPCILVQVRYKDHVYDPEKAQNEMTTVNEDGVYYALNNEDEMEHSLSHPSPKVVRRDENAERYVLCV